MKTRQLGQTNQTVSALALGTMAMAEFYGRRSDASALHSLKAALDLGINFIDTADMYGRGLSEELVGKAISQSQHDIVVSTKCGFVRPDEDINHMRLDGSPEYIKTACEQSLKRLNRDVIDVFFLHRVDPNVAVEESMGAMVDLIDAGKIKYIGLSDTTDENIERAVKVHPITAYQAEYSIWHREPELGLIDLLEKNSITFMPYSPLGRGFLSGNILKNEQLVEGDFRKILPRFQKENIEKNNHLLSVLREIAQELSCSPAQLSLAWALSKSANIVPIPGPKSAAQVYESCGATTVVLEQDMIARLEESMPVGSAFGEQYPTSMSAH